MSIENVSDGLLLSILVVKRVGIEIITMRGAEDDSGDSGVTDQIKRCLHRVTGLATEASVKTSGTSDQGFTGAEETCMPSVCQEFPSFFV